VRELVGSSRKTRVCRSELWPISHMGIWPFMLVRLAEAQRVGTAELREKALARWRLVHRMGAQSTGPVSGRRIGARLQSCGEGPVVGGGSTMNPIVDPMIADGAGIAGRGRDGLLVVPRRRGDPDQVLEVTSDEYLHLESTLFGSPYRYSPPYAPLTTGAIMLWEDSVAASGELIDGMAILWFSGPDQLTMRVHPADGSEPLDLPVTGVPSVATACPHQEHPDWAAHDSELDEALPDAAAHRAVTARQVGMTIVATPLFLEENMYAGYSLVFAGKHRIHVTGSSGFVFRYALLDRARNPEEVRYRVDQRLAADEPPSVVTNFEHRYLASAQLAARYRRPRGG
jgi:hypothetical protein